MLKFSLIAYLVLLVVEAGLLKPNTWGQLWSRDLVCLKGVAKEGQGTCDSFTTDLIFEGVANTLDEDFGR